jgi:hypothetical protein
VDAGFFTIGVGDFAAIAGILVPVIGAWKLVTGILVTVPAPGSDIGRGASITCGGVGPPTLPPLNAAPPCAIAPDESIIASAHANNGSVVLICRDMVVLLMSVRPVFHPIEDQTKSGATPFPCSIR